MVLLGQKVQDVITGFTGVAIGRVKYISGCNQCLVAPPVTQEGSFMEAVWLDEQRLVVQGGERITLDNGQTPGFDKQPSTRV